MKFKKSAVNSPNQLKPIDITCTSTSCTDALHCFKSKKDQIDKGMKGACRDCGANFIDWNRVHKRDIKDLKFTYNSLNNELIRYVYQENDILNQRAINYALRKGRKGLRARIEKELRDKVGKSKNFREGRQTKKQGNSIIPYAQHGTATCCRKCIEYWHGIEQGIELSDEDIAYFVELIMYFVENRLQGEGLEDEGIKVPSIRKTTLVR